MTERNHNVLLMEQKVAEHAFIIPISRHRYPDGRVNTDQFKENWEKQMEEFDRIPLWPEGLDQQGQPAEGKDPLQRAPYLVWLPAEDPAGAKGTILVAHGGGFVIRTGCEGPNIALIFQKLGYNTAVLSYRLYPYTRHDSRADMLQAIRLLRVKTAEEMLPGKLIVMGFSAGAMMCGNVSTIWEEGRADDPDPVKQQNTRPDAAVIAYGAMSEVSFPLPFMMPANDTDQNLFGANARDRYFFAPEKHVSPDTPPMFIWQTLSDDGRHGMCLARALQDAGVPYELHILGGGIHGLGAADGENDLGMTEPHIAHWVQLCDEWLQMVLK